MLWLVVILALCGMVRADYDCLCSYNVETPVFSTGLNSSKKVGYMYEFDCKPILPEKGINTTTWQVVAFEHQKGYIQLDQQMQIQACPGDPSSADMLTTESPTSTPSPTTSPTTSQTTSSTSSILIPTTGPLQSSAYSISTSPITQPTTLSSSTAKSTNNTTTIPKTNVVSTTMTRRSTNPTSKPSIKPPTTTQTKSTQRMSPKTYTQKTTSTSQTTRHTTTLRQTTPSTSAQRVTTAPKTSRQTTTQQSTTTSTRPSTASPSKTTARQTTVPQTQSTHTTRQTSTRQTTSAPTPSSVYTKVSSWTTTPSTMSQPMSTTKNTKSTSPTTTHWTTTTPSQPPIPAVQLGNVGLCPSSVVQYAKQDNEILTQIRHSCYTVVPHKYSWPHAEAVCNRRGGHLFHVSDRLENLAIYILLNTHFNHPVWMGLSDLNNEEHFEWTSNIPLNFTNWMPGRKTSGHHDEDCVVFVPYVDHGKWNDVQCGARNPFFEFFYEKHYFICQFPTRNAPTAAPTVAPTISIQFIQGSYHACPPNVISSVRSEGGSLELYGTSCYERVSQRLTWNAAERDCEYKGGHLVHIGSPQEEAAISQFLSHTDSQHAVWIGLHDQGHEETFTWTSGERLIYTNWLPGRKSNINHSVEDCVVLLPYKQGMWDDIPCGRYYINHGHGQFEFLTEAHPYICEYHVTPGGPSLIGR